MGYIRSNEDYFRSIGYSAEEARVEAAAVDRGIDIDEGYCNPIKLKAAEDIRSVIRDELASEVTGD